MVTGMRDGRHAVIEQLLANGVRYVFGNPGTVEQGLLDVMREYEGRLDYIFALQESIAVAMADGYARCSGKLGVIQLHSGVGLGNGIGNLYQAFRGHSPLLVIAGDSGVQYDAMDAQMSGDLVSIAKPVTKYAIRATHPASLLRVLRRAIKIALTPPYGPVFLNLPMDVLDAENSEPVFAAPRLSTACSAPAFEIERMAAALSAARKPLIVMGDGVAVSGAQKELEEVATLIGAEIWGANSAEVNVAASCPLYCGTLGHMFGFESARRTMDSDAVMICGTYVFPEVFPELEHRKVFADDAAIFHIDLDAFEIAKNFRVDVGVVADPKATLVSLAEALKKVLIGEPREAAALRTETIGARNRKALEAARKKDLTDEEQKPLPFSTFTRLLAERVPDAIIFDEALTCSPALSRYFVADQPGTYSVTRGGSLGVGLPGAIGMKLARPERPVIGVTGDGGSLYTIQCLWTAAHHSIAAKFVICNNHEYRLLKWNLDEYRKERNDVTSGYPDCFDIAQPAIDFTLLAQGFGVKAERVETVEQMQGAIERALTENVPYLIEVMVAP